MNSYAYIETIQSQDGLDLLAKEQIMFRILDAWRWAQNAKKLRRYPTIDDMREIAKQIEPDANDSGYRTMNVRVQGQTCPRPSEISQQIELLWACVPGIAPKDFYKVFQDIHPFFDGNKRIGIVLSHWIGGTLDDPQLDG